jgi:ABC-type bacteriocin/lantibiotic exporter with double-glycine peptidase domain
VGSLQELAQGRTSVFVAHRLSTIRNCEKIVVMEAGRVIEQGNHEAGATPLQSSSACQSLVGTSQVMLNCAEHNTLELFFAL